MTADREKDKSRPSTHTMNVIYSTWNNCKFPKKTNSENNLLSSLKSSLRQNWLNQKIDYVYFYDFGHPNKENEDHSFPSTLNQYTKINYYSKSSKNYCPPKYSNFWKKLYHVDPFDIMHSQTAYETHFNSHFENGVLDYYRVPKNTTFKVPISPKYMIRDFKSKCISQKKMASQKKMPLTTKVEPGKGLTALCFS